MPRDPYGREYVFVDGGRKLVWVFSRGSDGALQRYPPDIGSAIHLSEVRSR